MRSENPKPYGSYGNSSAMRVGPIAWACHKLGVAIRFAELSACCTHNHHEGILGAQTTVMAIHNGIKARANNEYVTKEQIKKILDKCVKFSGYDINIRPFRMPLPSAYKLKRATCFMVLHIRQG